MASLRCFVFLWCCLAGLAGRAQDSGGTAPVRQDTVLRTPVLDSAARAAHRDSVRRRRALRDTLAARARRDSIQLAVRDSVRRDSLRRDSIAHTGAVVKRDSLANAPVGAGTPGGNATAPAAAPAPPAAPVRPDTKAGIPKIRVGRDLLFYVVLLLALWMGILKSGYQKYYDDLFTVFFRSSLRQHQIREQLLQARLPSLLYNLFFVGCAGTFLYLLAVPYAARLGHPEWQIWIAAIGAVALLYAVKFVGLKLSGWVFGMTGAVDTYIFIVFLVNKILGVALLPIVVLLAFAQDPLQSAAATLGVMLVAGMLIYRFIRSYRPVWEEVQMSRFHFFLYLCAFEIAPLLLIYKTMLKLL
ncbi:DUF4271 domain-containing protein [Dinghuibacter silviterrae]|uniref:Uncharacterized protein DUF4271 n=1 Tax=Dinghuibacter silviterrae TaxID=1539049 RepID=A0A4R8DPP1_9BACT|nr:DUF4271 domain-containing protein [Dinghuibacter silviterrae]TDX00090.1 uncharacterized protein DUF4271 [Dinghuibacter silviterrae]